LNLKDKVTNPLKKISSNVAVTSRQIKKASNDLKKFGSSAMKNINGATNSVLKLTSAVGGITSGFGFKTGLTEAMNLEGYKMQLETATKSTQKAAKLMRYSVMLANKTPYEAGELVEGAAKLESMGMSAKKYLVPIGDMAAATNKSFDQAVEARIDAQNGELERLKEFGIKKGDIQAKADQLFGKNVAINKKGQIKDQTKFNEALDAVIAERFKGGMDKQAKTLRGKLSTVTGVFKSGMATILGMQDDGSIAKGSAFEQLSNGAGQLAGQFEALQGSGKLLEWQRRVAIGFKSLVSGIKQIALIVKSNIGLIKQGAGFVVVIAIVAKLAALLITLHDAFGKLKTVFMAVKVLMGLSGIATFGVILGIAALVAAIVVLFKKSASFRAMIGSVATKLVELGQIIKLSVCGAISSATPSFLKLIQSMAPVVAFIAKVFKPVASAAFGLICRDIQNLVSLVASLFSAVCRILSGIVDFVVGVFTGDWQKAWSGVKNIFGGILDGIKGLFSSFTEGILSKVKFITDAVQGVKKSLFGASNEPSDPKGGGNRYGYKPAGQKFARNALGTSYFKGGLTSINERCRGEIVDLPSGSRVYPHDKSVQMARGEGREININVQVGVIGDEEMAERVGGVIARKIKRALDNQ
jgi:hypothetical protein